MLLRPWFPPAKTMHCLEESSRNPWDRKTSLPIWLCGKRIRASMFTKQIQKASGEERGERNMWPWDNEPACNAARNNVKVLLVRSTSASRRSCSSLLSFPERKSAGSLAADVCSLDHKSSIVREHRTDCLYILVFLSLLLSACKRSEDADGNWFEDGHTYSIPFNLWLCYSPGQEKICLIRRRQTGLRQARSYG